jgi:hypothetical protein
LAGPEDYLRRAEQAERAAAGAMDAWLRDAFELLAVEWRQLAADAQPPPSPESADGTAPRRAAS